MQAATFWRTVTRDHADLLERTLEILGDADAHYCVIGGQAVNAYAEPVVSLDLKRQKDLADIARLLENHPDLRTLVPEAILQRLVV